MRYILIISVCLAFVGCESNLTPISENSNTGTAAAPSQKPQTAVAHTTENQQPPTAAPASGKSKWTQSGDPIDTAEFDGAISSAEKALAAKSADEAAKKAVADAYLKRGVALTDARQYASALGDYRKVLKHDPTNAEAKQWIEQIIGIYESINRDYPKEGEEPPPLPIKKP